MTTNANGAFLHELLDSGHQVIQITLKNLWQFIWFWWITMWVFRILYYNTIKFSSFIKDKYVIRVFFFIIIFTCRVTRFKQWLIANFLASLNFLWKRRLSLSWIIFELVWIKYMNSWQHRINIVSTLQIRLRSDLLIWNCALLFLFFYSSFGYSFK